MKLFKRKSKPKEFSESDLALIRTKYKEFSESDLALIRMMPGATVGGGMVFPSGLKTREGMIILTDDLEENVELCRSILK